MRVLFLASYFPRPEQPLIGTWALEQARALAHCCDLRVACCVPYIPSVLGIVGKARPWIRVPREHTWPKPAAGSAGGMQSDVRVTYLKSLYYPVSVLKQRAFRNPGPQRALMWASVRRRLLRLVDDFRPEVIYCHHTDVNGYLAARIRQLRQIPFAVTDHDFQEVTECATWPARRAFFEKVKREAGRSICVAKRMEEDTKRLFPQYPTTTVYNGINPLPSEIFGTPRPAELQGRRVILSVGMFAPRKAFPLLVEAFKPVSERHPEALLRIIGDGTDRPAIEAAVATHKLEGKVTLLGLQPQARVFQEMAWSDVFALPSWNEPFATVYIEAMGAGLPVIAASDGGIADVVKDGVHGLLVPPKRVDAVTAALERLLSDEPARREMGKNARAMVENELMWSANARRLCEIFGEILEQQRTPQSSKDGVLSARA